MVVGGSEGRRGGGSPTGSQERRPGLRLGIRTAGSRPGPRPLCSLPCPQTLAAVLTALPRSSPAELTISALSLALLVPVKELNARFRDRLPTAIPGEIAMVSTAAHRADPAGPRKPPRPPPPGRGERPRGDACFAGGAFSERRDPGIPRPGSPLARSLEGSLALPAAPPCGGAGHRACTPGGPGRSPGLCDARLASLPSGAHLHFPSPQLDSIPHTAHRYPVHPWMQPSSPA